MTRYALIFSGQGNQHPAMLPWLAPDVLQDQTCQQLGIAAWRPALADSDWATANRNAQILLTGLALAAWRQLTSLLPAPVAIAGYSVGEIAAYSAAGVFDASTAPGLARERAVVMDDCALQAPGGLLGLAGAMPQAVDQINAASGTVVAIRNGVDSVVLGGRLPALDLAAQLGSAQGARVTRLTVGLASHTPLMADAAKAFSRIAAATPMSRPRVPLFGYRGDPVRTVQQAATALAGQMAETVRWDLAMDGIAARGPTRVLEIGPGQALARLWRQRHPDIEARSCDDFRSTAAVVAWLDRD